MGDNSLRVLDEVAQLGVLLLADGRLEGHRLLGDLLDLAHAVGAHIHLGADLLRGRVAAEVLKQLALHAHELVDGLDHMDRDTDGTGLVGDGAGNGLTDPPRGVRGDWESSSSPMGVSRDTGSWEIFWISRTRSALISISAPISSGVGSRPRS